MTDKTHLRSALSDSLTYSVVALPRGGLGAASGSTVQRCGVRVSPLPAVAYQSQRESPEDRAARQVNKLRVRLCWKEGIFNPAGGRPKAMHWATYWRLKASHDVKTVPIFAGILTKLRKTG